MRFILCFLTIVFFTLLPFHVYGQPSNPPGGGGGGGDITSVGDCSTGGCFTGISGTTLTGQSGTKLRIVSNVAVDLDDGAGNVEWSFDTPTKQIFYDQFSTMVNTTSDGADNGSVGLCSGGSCAAGRGSFIIANGEQRAGTFTTGGIVYSTSATGSAYHRFDAAGERLHIGPFANMSFISNGFGIINCLAGEACDGLWLSGGDSDGGSLPTSAQGSYVLMHDNVADFTTEDGNLILGSGNIATAEVKLQTDGTDKVTVRNSGNLILENNLDVGFKNAAGSADVPVLSVDSNDDTIIGVANTKDIIFDWANGFPRYTFDQSGNVAGGDAADPSFQWNITTVSPDANDNRRFAISSAGAASQNRGAHMLMYGNEAASPGDFEILAGDVAGGEIRFATDGGYQWIIEDDGDLAGQGNNKIVMANDTDIAFKNNAGTADINALSVNSVDTTLLQCVNGGSIFFLEEGGTQMFSMEAPSRLNVEGSAGGIYQDTSDGSDSGTTYLAGGGSNTENRGAGVWAYGNEGGFPGLLFLHAGDDAANGEIWFRTNSQTRGKFQYDGDLELSSGGTLAVDTATPADACMGDATLNGTTAVTINTTCITTGSRVFLARNSAPPSGASEYADNIVDGVSFDITSNNNSDNAGVAWLIINNQ